MSTPAVRILIVRVGAMGDVLHGMPAVAALRHALPHAKIGWAVEPRWSPLLLSTTDQPLIAAVHMVEAKAWSKRPLSLATLRSILALRHALRADRYDIAIDLQGTLRSAVIARISGAVRVVGSAAPRERPARLLYTERVPTRSAHVVDQAADLVSAATGLALVATDPPLPRDQAAERWCNALLEHDLRPVVGLAPTAGWGAKEWPAQRYGELARALHGEGCRVLVNASPHGPDPVAMQVIAASGGTAEAVACTLPQLIALLRRTSLVVAGDTGPLHLADALGRAILGLFGPTDPARNGPSGPRSAVLRHPISRTDHRRHPTTEAGLKALSTEEVLSAARELLRRDSGAAGILTKA